MNTFLQNNILTTNKNMSDTICKSVKTWEDGSFCKFLLVTNKN